MSTNSLFDSNQKSRQIKKAAIASACLTLAVFLLSNFVQSINASTENGLTATYYDNINFTNPKVNRVDDNIDFQWKYGSPNLSMNSDTYSVRWQGQIAPRFSEDYNFSVYSDDGVRLWIDGRLVVDNWTDHSPTENFGSIHLNAGTKYDIKLEYFENSGESVARLFWASASQPKEIVPSSQLFTNTVSANQTQGTVLTASSSSNLVNGLNAEYFSGKNFDSSKLKRTDSQINFTWRVSSPDPAIPQDNFAVRWTGQIVPRYSEAYTFYTLTDDGVRLWVNDVLIINNWSDHAVTENRGTVNLEAGTKYNIKMEFYENWGEAAAILAWQSNSQTKEIVPQSHLYNGKTNTIASAVETLPTASATDKQISAPVQTASPLSGNLYVNPNSLAKQWADNNRSSRPYESTMVAKIAAQPTAQWLGGWNWDIYNDVNKTVVAAENSGSTPVFVAYNIPQRDCGGYSAGGTGSADAYRSWIGSITSAIGNRKAIVILEPDALSGIDCLSVSDKSMRTSLLRDAVGMLKKNSNTKVYMDAGHSGWIKAETMADRLNASGISSADGFALNTSNYVTTADNITYGQRISSLTSGKRFIIDTSRNGAGPSGSEWCNPQGRALGATPTTATGNSLIDAYLWVKAPGESDGNCNGGPSAGQFWPEYAVGLGQKAGW